MVHLIASLYRTFTLPLHAILPPLLPLSTAASLYLPLLFFYLPLLKLHSTSPCCSSTGLPHPLLAVEVFWLDPGPWQIWLGSSDWSEFNTSLPQSFSNKLRHKALQFYKQQATRTKCQDRHIMPGIPIPPPHYTCMGHPTIVVSHILSPPDIIRHLPRPPRIARSWHHL